MIVLTSGILMTKRRWEGGTDEWWHIRSLRATETKAKVEGEVEMVEKPLTPLCGWKPLRQLVMSRVAVSPAACHISRGRLQSPFQWAKKKAAWKLWLSSEIVTSPLPLCGLLVFHGWEWESANEVLVLESVNDLGGRFTPQNVVFLLRATEISWGTCVHPIAMRRDPGSTVALWDPSAENKWIYLINRRAKKEMCNFFFSFSGCTFCNNRRWDVCRQKLTVLSQ